MEIEERVSPIAKKELSKWVSLLPISSLQLPSLKDSSTISPIFASQQKATTDKEGKDQVTIIN